MRRDDENTTKIQRLADVVCLLGSTIFNALVWRDRGASPRPTAPEADAQTARLPVPVLTCLSTGLFKQTRFITTGHLPQIESVFKCLLKIGVLYK